MFVVIWQFLSIEVRKMIHSCVKLLTMLFHVKIHNTRFNGKRFSYANIFEYTVDKYPNRVQFISVDNNEEITLKQMDDFANQIAAWLVSLGKN